MNCQQQGLRTYGVDDLYDEVSNLGITIDLPFIGAVKWRGDLATSCLARLI